MRHQRLWISYSFPKPFDISFSLCYPMFIDKCYEEKSSQSEDGQASPESESGHGWDDEVHF